MTLQTHPFGHFFENDFAYVFFSNQKALEAIEQKKSPSLFFSKQVHEDHLLKIETSKVPQTSSYLIEADGMHSHQKQIALGIQTADCVPCFLASSEQICSLHLGWRSLAKGLLKKALLEFSETDSLFAFIGPHIFIDSFEVGEEVFLEFDHQLSSSDWWHRKGDKYHISLKTIIEQQCLQAHPKIELHHVPQNTYESHMHYSYRRSSHRNEVEKGRNVSYGFLK